MRYKSSKKTRQKRKIRNARKDIPFVLPCSNHSYLNYAPYGSNLHSFAGEQALRLTSFDYLRRAHFVNPVQRGKSLPLSPKKRAVKRCVNVGKNSKKVCDFVLLTTRQIGIGLIHICSG